ncbi:hypothetical protein BC827DRAFT_1372325 [Russula dissimulans]|nr:hypothetical protein BC827DRAFT_1372325 [Russula dissimulans]
MLALSVVMYVVSATHWALNISYIEAFKAGLLTKVVTIEFALIYLPSVNYMLSDGILLWRAWVLWNRRFLLFITPLIFLVCTFGTTIASVVNFFNIFQVQSGHIIMNKGTSTSTTLLSSAAFFTIGTNLWATGLIFIRAWQHRRVLRSLGVKGTFRSNTEKTLAFLVGSGVLYLCIWVRSNPLTVLHESLYLYPLADRVYVNLCCREQSWDGFLSLSHRSTRCSALSDRLVPPGHVPDDDRRRRCDAIKHRRHPVSSWC